MEEAATGRGFVSLAGHEPFASGGNRLCYVHPSDPSRCVKVLRPGHGGVDMRRQAPAWKRFRPAWVFDENLREFRAYRRIGRLAGEYAWTHVPRCHGLVETDVGEGASIVTELVRNADGRISGCLKTKLRSTGNDPFFRQAVEAFAEFLRRTGVPTRDLLLHNLVAKERSECGNGAFTIMMIDGFGVAGQFPPIFRPRFLARIRTERKLRKFYGKIDDFCGKYAIPYFPE